MTAVAAATVAAAVAAAMAAVAALAAVERFQPLANKVILRVKELLVRMEVGCSWLQGL